MRISSRITPLGLLGLTTLFFLTACASQDATSTGIPGSLNPIVKNTLPAVVKIDVVETVDQSNANGSGNTPFFDFFFDNPDSQGERTFKNESLGSGVIVRKIDSTYYVITNAHVIGSAETMLVTLDDGTEYTSKLVGKDPKRDLALLSFTSEKEIPIITLADSDKVQVGDWVLAIGSPYGFQSTVTLGIVSALNRRGGPSDTITDFIQTDAAINKGNSGGALLDMRGNLIGINTWISSQGGGSIGLAFAVPALQVKKVVDDLISFGKISTPWLGVHMFSLDKEFAAQYPGSPERGVLVVGVYRNAPAWTAGLRPGDIITQANNRMVQTSDEVIQSVADRSVGESITLHVSRGGAPVVIRLNLAPRAEDAVIASYGNLLWPGFALYPLTPALRQEMNLDEAVQGMVVRQVVSGTPADRAGINFGDIVVSINNGAPLEPQSFFKVLAGLEMEKTMELRIIKGGKELTLTLETQ